MFFGTFWEHHTCLYIYHALIIKYLNTILCYSEEILQSVTVDLPRLCDGKRRPLLPQALDGPGIVVLVVVEKPRHTVQLEDVRLHICDNDIRLPVLKEELDVIRLVTLK